MEIDKQYGVDKDEDEGEEIDGWNGERGADKNEDKEIGKELG